MAVKVHLAASKSSIDRYSSNRHSITHREISIPPKRNILNILNILNCHVENLQNVLRTSAPRREETAWRGALSAVKRVFSPIRFRPFGEGEGGEAAARSPLGGSWTRTGVVIRG